jgi:hypothetical protein
VNDKMTISQFCDAHRACDEGRRWALTHCETMRDVWRDAEAEYLIWVATRRGVLTDRELRLFAVSSARRVQHLMTDPRSVAALDVAERHANGLATDAELAAARDAAWAAAGAAAGAAAWAAARDAAWAAAGDAQAAWLRENTLPDFARSICVAVEGTR